MVDPTTSSQSRFEDARDSSDWHASARGDIREYNGFAIHRQRRRHACGVQVTAATPNFPFPQPFSFYAQQANGTLLSYWATEFVRIGARPSQFGWKDIVEDYVPVPIP